MDVLIYILYVLLAIAVLLFLILVHELGHYIAGRILKFKITEFSIGFGKAIFSKTNKRGEKISLRIIPLGGYCSFAGEADDNAEPQPGDFNSFAPWKRIIVFLAGIFMNFVVAFIFSFIALVSIGGRDIVKIQSVTQDAPYSSSIAFKEGDVVFEIDGQKLDIAFGTTFTQAKATMLVKAQNYVKEEAEKGNTEAKVEDYAFTAKVRHSDGQMEVLDNVRLFEVTSTGTDGNEVKSYVFGVTYDFYVHSFGEALGRCWSYSFGLSWLVLKSLWQLFTFQVPITEVGGTITTVKLMAENTRANPVSLLLLIPLISANLGVFNLLPFPALDGSHVLFTLIEWIRKKPINRKVENTIHFVGLCILFAFIVIVDILHFVL